MALSNPKLAFVGHISIDEVENMNGTRVQPGGAALYSAIAANALNARAAIVSAVGRDFPYADCLTGIDSSNVRTTKAPSTRFHIRYNKNWEARYLKVEPGAGTRITASSFSQSFLRGQDMIHISPMKPRTAANIVDKILNSSHNVKASISTWIGYMQNLRNRRTLMKLASRVDFFILNEFEAKALTQTSSLSFALEKIRTHRLIVTMGRLGAVISGQEEEPQMIPALSVPTGNVVDTTGAGDTWNGAFLATYVTDADLMKAVTVASILASIKCSQWGFQATRRMLFRRPSDVVEYVLALREGSMQKRITDFTGHK